MAKISQIISKNFGQISGYFREIANPRSRSTTRPQNPDLRPGKIPSSAVDLEVIGSQPKG